MRRLPLAPLFLILPCVLHAQMPFVGIPPLRLTPEQVAQAAQRIDEAVIAQERERWER